MRRKVDAKTIAKYEEQYREMRRHEEIFGFEEEEEAPASAASILLNKLKLLGRKK